MPLTKIKGSIAPNVDKSPISVAALKALTDLNDLVTVATQGYYTAGDGGHGTYRYSLGSVATTDNGSVIQPDSGTGRWLLLETSPNILQFGALAGSDSTAAIQANITWASTNGRPPLKIPAANASYKYTTLTFTQAGHISIIGEGSGDQTQVTGTAFKCSALESTNTSSNSITIAGSFEARGVTIQDVMLLSSTTAAVLSVDDASHVTIDRTIIQNDGADGSGVLLNDVYLLTISNSIIVKEANLRGTGFGVKLTLTAGVLAGLYNIIASTIKAFGTNMLAGDAAVTTSRFRSINLIGSQLKDGNIGCDLLGGVAAANLIGCYIEGQQTEGLAVSWAAQNVICSGTYFNNPSAARQVRLGSSAAGGTADVKYFKNVSILNCAIEGISDASDGIRIRGDASITLSDNVTIQQTSFAGASGATTGRGTSVFEGAAIVDVIDATYSGTLASQVLQTVPARRISNSSTRVQDIRTVSNGVSNRTSAASLTITDTGNYYRVTGATTINEIQTPSTTVSGLTHEITLMFTSTPTLTNNYGTPTGGYSVMNLAGGVNFVATANDVVTLVYWPTDNTWKEKSRSLN